MVSTGELSPALELLNEKRVALASAFPPIKVPVTLEALCVVTIGDGKATGPVRVPPAAFRAEMREAVIARERNLAAFEALERAREQAALWRADEDLIEFGKRVALVARERSSEALATRVLAEAFQRSLATSEALEAAHALVANFRDEQEFLRARIRGEQFLVLDFHFASAGRSATWEIKHLDSAFRERFSPLLEIFGNAPRVRTEALQGKLGDIFEVFEAAHVPEATLDAFTSEFEIYGEESLRVPEHSAPKGALSVSVAREGLRAL